MDNAEGASQSPKSGSSKTLLIVVLLIVVIAAGAGGYFFLSKNQTPQTSQSQTSAQNVEAKPKEAFITSIKDALMGSQSLQCNFTDDSGRTITSYVKNGAIRTEVSASDPKQSGSMIFKDKKMYFWNGAQGTVMAFDVMAMMDEVAAQAPTVSPVVTGTQNPQDFVAAMEKYKESCKNATVADDMFIPPSDVKFTDMSSVMKSDKMKAMPSGVMPSGMSEEELKAIQQKFLQQ